MTPAFILCATAIHSDNEVVFYAKDVQDVNNPVLVTDDKYLGLDWYVKSIEKIPEEQKAHTVNEYTHMIRCMLVGDFSIPEYKKDTPFFIISKAIGEYAPRS